MDERHYEFAKGNSKDRQEFLRRIDMEKYAPFVRDIIYFEGKDGDRIMETRTIPLSCGPLDTFSTISVSDYAFNKFSWMEFWNVLVLHEGLHSLQNFFEAVLPDEKIISLNFENRHSLDYSERQIRQEIEAHRNQIGHPSFWQCSEEFRSDIQEYLKFYKNSL